MTISYQREELHRIIDQLDEKWLSKVHSVLSRFLSGKKSPGPLNHWNSLRTKVLSFTHLPDNWDGYGAVPVSKEVAETCLRFLQKLPEPYQYLIEPENITPSPYSTITLDWEAASGTFVTVETGRTKANFFARLPGNREMENDSFNPDGTVPADLLEALQLLFSSTPARCAIS